MTHEHKLIRAALERACERDGLLDLELIGHSKFKEAVKLAKLVNGEPFIDEALSAMKAKWPEMFFSADWSRLGDKEFEEKTERLKSSLSRHEETKAIPKVDSADLDEAELLALSNLIRSAGNGDRDRAIVTRAITRQKEAANA
jgi:hypothetical protein